MSAGIERRLPRGARQMLWTIADQTARRGRLPTSPELQEALGRCRVTVNWHLACLEEAGLVRCGGVELVGLPGHRLTGEEMAWCQANPERVQAMMALDREVG